MDPCILDLSYYHKICAAGRGVLGDYIGSQHLARKGQNQHENDSSYKDAKLVKGRLPTKMNLLRRGIGILIEEACCIFCKTAQENENHLFLSCNMIYNLWCNIYGWMQYARAQQGKIKEHSYIIVVCSKGRIGRKRGRQSGLQ